MSDHDQDPSDDETIGGEPAGRDPLEAARALSPRLIERAREGERLATMPADVVTAVAEAGLFTLLLPPALRDRPRPGSASIPATAGPCDPRTVVDVIETLSHADGSAGWSVMVGNSTSFLAWFPVEVAQEVLATSRHPVISSVFAPRGQAVPGGPDQYRVTGRWAFNSGSAHCDWFMAAAVVSPDGASTRPEPDLSNVRFALLPARDAEIVETWDAAGLQGTGSHDLAAEAIPVPASHIANPFHEPPRHDEPVYRLPFWTLVMVLMAGFPLGVARRALDELERTAHRGARSHGGSLAEDPLVQVDVARASATLDAARTLVHSAIGEAWEAVQRDGKVELPGRARVTAATAHAMATAVQVVDIAFRHGGGSALYMSNPLQRCFRDIHAGAQHIAYGVETWRNVGRARLGVPQIELRI